MTTFQTMQEAMGDKLVIVDCREPANTTSNPSLQDSPEERSTQIAESSQRVVNMIDAQTRIVDGYKADGQSDSPQAIKEALKLIDLFEDAEKTFGILLSDEQRANLVAWKAQLQKVGPPTHFDVFCRGEDSAEAKRLLQACEYCAGDLDDAKEKIDEVDGWALDAFMDEVDISAEECNEHTQAIASFQEKITEAIEEMEACVIKPLDDFTTVSAHDLLESQQAIAVIRSDIESLAAQIGDESSKKFHSRIYGENGEDSKSANADDDHPLKFDLLDVVKVLNDCTQGIDEVIAGLDTLYSKVMK